jgi:hypothetical protein
MDKIIKKKKTFKIPCECGIEIVGFSEHHAKENLKLHKNSKKHKERMKLINKGKKKNV